MQYTYIEGDFSESVEFANEVNGSNYGGYNLFTNNCLHYAKDVLAEGVFDDPVAQEYIVNSPQIIPVVYHVEILRGYSHSVNQRNREVCQYERVY